MVMKLYSYWRSTAAYRVRIALNLKQLSYQILDVDLVKQGGQQHSAEYQQLNPNQLVPTLIDDDKIITQSASILEYLEETYPDVSLLPEDNFLRSQIRSMAQTVACDIHPLNNLRVLQYLKNQLSLEQPQVDLWYKHWVRTGFSAIEKTLQTTSGRYCFSDQLSLADVFLVPQVYNANRFQIDTQDFPLIEQINQNCLKLDGFQQASPEQQAKAVN